MNRYIIIHNMENYSRKMLIASYEREGFSAVYDDEKTVCLKKSDTDVDETIEQGMLKVICSQLKRAVRDKAVSTDVSDIMNRHIERLTANKMSSLKFHDPFNDEVKHLVTRLLIGEDNEI